MAILPKNRSLSKNNYEKSRKDVIIETQSMLDTELFFKMKEQELLSQIEKQELLNEPDIVDEELNIKVQNKKSA